MARSLLLCVLLAACGRLGFDRTTRNSDGSVGDDDGSGSAGDIDAMPMGIGLATLASIDGPWPNNFDLTADGTLDWAHWGYTGLAGFDRKDNGVNAISTFVVIGSGTLVHDMDTSSMDWTDGDPHGTITGTPEFVYIDSPNASGDGFAFSVAADSQHPRRLRIFAGSYCADLQLDLSFRDALGNTTDKTFDNPNPTGIAAVYNVVFQAPFPGDELKVLLSIENNHCLDGDVGEVGLKAATLQQL